MRLCLGLPTHNIGLDAALRLLDKEGMGAVGGREKISLNVKAKVIGLFEAAAKKRHFQRMY